MRPVSVDETSTWPCLLVFTFRPVKCRIKYEAPNLRPSMQLGQCCHAPPGAVIDEFGAILE